jgi:uncharacterized protein (TIGR02246 family)
MRFRFVFAIVTGLVVGLMLSQMSLPSAVHSQEAAKSSESAELEELKAAAAAFEKAFNAGNATAIAAQFLENAEAVDDEGNVLTGRDQIEASFTALFKDFPKARIAIELTSLRRLGPDVAVEDGYSTTTLDPDEPGSRSPYTVVHLRRQGRWLIASVRDFPADVPEATAHDQLQTLDWLVGHWVDESPDGRVETTCEWSDDGNYLLQDYVVKTRRGELRGAQRIGWDGLRQTIRSWAFDRNGAFTEAFWTPIENGWILKVEGVTPDGRSASGTRLVTLLNRDAFQIDSTSLIVGNELLPDTTLRVVRQPPKPAQ